jgi:hypothetical protein
MSSAKEISDAILIVIKKIAKWILLTAITVGVLIFIAVKANDLWEWQTNGRHADKVSIMFVDLIEKACDKEYPYMYIITNESSKTVEEVNFSVEVRKTGYSKVINTYTSITDSKILKPSETSSMCFRAIGKDYKSEVLRDREVDYKLSYKNVKFQK